MSVTECIKVTDIRASFISAGYLLRAHELLQGFHCGIRHIYNIGLLKNENTMHTLIDRLIKFVCNLNEIHTLHTCTEIHISQQDNTKKALYINCLFPLWSLSDRHLVRHVTLLEHIYLLFTLQCIYIQLLTRLVVLFYCRKLG